MSLWQTPKCSIKRSCGCNSTIKKQVGYDGMDIGSVEKNRKTKASTIVQRRNAAAAAVAEVAASVVKSR